ncbi:LysR family transcriptional regulator [Luteimonas sp. Y-2-2-4F]|nr:LysR substrate-binding domain-containing protein [Luteimonas sp. Y-2-2-4F]MCD9033295.1 LysR family transcriptional regulator [Luteimonas sp. Y-2-2-4F]
MNFQQLRSVREAIRHDFNLTETAEVLHASQSAVSRQIRELEDELGIEIFHRYGKRLTGLTTPGREIAGIIERILKDRESLKKASEQYRGFDHGSLSVAATHAQIRYRLPDVVLGFRERFPQVSLSLQQCAPGQILELLRGGSVELGFLPSGLTGNAELVQFEAYRWSHRIVAPVGHPLLALEAPGLVDIARYPVITFEEGMVGRARINEAFRAQGVEPNVIISAVDSDVIKTYVELGLGVGIIAERAYNPAVDRKIAMLEGTDLIPPITTNIAVRRGAYLRDYAVAFIQSVVPGLGAQRIHDRIHGGPAELIAA